MDQGRQLELDERVPDARSGVRQLPFLSGAEKYLFAQVQSRACANLVARLERIVTTDVENRDAFERIVQTQAGSDAEYFMRAAGRAFDAIHAEAIHNTMLADYRRQYVRSST